MEGFLLKIMYDKLVNIKVLYLIALIQSGRSSIFKACLISSGIKKSFIRV
jgi:hypothetical protein